MKFARRILALTTLCKSQSLIKCRFKLVKSQRVDSVILSRIPE